MRKAEWLACANPEPMLVYLLAKNETSLRKLRLFALACCRRIGHLMVDARSRAAIEMAEKAADGLVPDEELAHAAAGAYAAATEDRAYRDDVTAAPEHAALNTIGVLDANGSPSCLAFDVGNAAFNAAAAVANHAAAGTWESVLNAEKRVQAELLRDIIANPFRPPRTIEAPLLTREVVALATTIYDERRFDRLPDLADLLEEAGCKATDLLGHLAATPHVRGCWAVDAILGKS